LEQLERYYKVRMYTLRTFEVEEGSVLKIDCEV
jgi:hypothetical protein